MIKLSRKTLNAEVIIINANTTLNSNNLYYTLNDSSIEKLNLEIGNESALIEILFKNDDNFTDIIDLTGKTIIYLNKQFNFIKIPKNYKSKIITFNLNKEGESNISIYHDYFISGYSRNYQLNKENVISLNNFIFIMNEQYKDGIQLMEDEYYCLVIQTIKNNLNIKVNIKIKENEQKDNNNNENKDYLRLKDWHVILIIVGSLISLVLVIFWITYCRDKRNFAVRGMEAQFQNLTAIEV